MKDYTYRGHVVSGRAVRPEASKVEAVEQFKVPETETGASIPVIDRILQEIYSELCYHSCTTE